MAEAQYTCTDVSGDLDRDGASYSDLEDFVVCKPDRSYKPCSQNTSNTLHKSKGYYLFCHTSGGTAYYGIWRVSVHDNVQLDSRVTHVICMSRREQDEVVASCRRPKPDYW